MTFLRLIPSWVWVALGIALVALGIGKAIGSYLTLTEDLAVAKKDLSNLVITNSNLAASNRELIQDARDRASINENIQNQTKKSDTQFDNLDSKLQAAITERDALEAAVDATEAITTEPGKDQQVNKLKAPNTPQKLAVQPAKKPVEIGILWEAYCLDSTSPKCPQVK